MTKAPGLVFAVVLLGCNERPPAFTSAQTLGGRTIDAAVLNAGADVYRMRCVTCHGADGGGNGPGARGLRKAPTDFRTGQFPLAAPGGELPTDAALAAIVREGRVESGMPPWPGLRPEDRDAVVQYLKTFSERWRAPSEVGR